MPAVELSKTAKLTFCAVMSALCVALMMLARIVSVTDYAISVICSLMIGAVMIEAGWKWAIAAFIVTGFLGALLGSNECAAVFIVFLGYYPIIKPSIERLKKIPAYIIKIVLFNIAIVGLYLVLDYLKFIPLEEMGILGRYTNLVVLILANIVFLIYDYLFNALMRTYYVRLHPRILSIFKH